MSDSQTHHITPLSTYLNIGMTLLGLTVVTVWVAQYDLGPLNLVVAMLIAATKGTLVALFFMHLKYTSKIYSVVFVGALTMLAVFIILVMADTSSRDQIYEIKSGQINPAVIYEDSNAAEPVVDSTVTAVDTAAGLPPDTTS